MAAFLALDLGGTNLKAALFSPGQLDKNPTDFPICTVPSGIAGANSAKQLLSAIENVLKELSDGRPDIGGVGISTAGIVDYAGEHYLATADHLAILRDPAWLDELRRRLNAAAALINDADAALIGARCLELIPPESSATLLVPGTGLGCAVCRKLHRIRPGRELPLLGSIRTPAGSYDEIASLSRLAGGGKLTDLLRKPAPALSKYLDDFAGIITTAAILYQLDQIVLAGGLAAAAAETGFDLAGELRGRLPDPIPELRRPLSITTTPLGNRLQLLGAAHLAAGCADLPVKQLPEVAEMPTEQPLFPELELTDLSADRLAELLSEAENEVTSRLGASLPVIAAEAQHLADRLRQGGRIVYLGAGTSGRIAALDAVELPCTYGIEESRAVALIAGGNDEAALTIESNGEEDASSLPELLLLNLTEADTVIGISASGSAFFVRSGLAFARRRGCRTIMIQESGRARIECDAVVALHSGSEVVAGSTRMKAGTATKKALNFLSTAAMIKLGRTEQSRMKNLQPSNEKLRRRAGEMNIPAG